MEIRRLLIITSMIAFILLVSQCFVFRYTKTLSPSPDDKGSTFTVVQNARHLNNSGVSRFHPTGAGTNILDAKESFDYKTNKKAREKAVDLALETDGNLNKGFLDENVDIPYKSLIMANGNQKDVSVIRKTTAEFSYSPLTKEGVLVDSNRTAYKTKASNSPGMGEIRNQVAVVSSQSRGSTINSIEKVDPRYPDIFVAPNVSSGQEENIKKRMEKLENDNKAELVKNDSIVINDKIVGFYISTLKRPLISIFQIYRKLSMIHKSSCLKRPQCRQTSQRDRELLYARMEIENASVLKSTPGISASVFRNVSMFTRSYELMEKMLKVYIYEEGEKPIFHQPLLTGIYASEGWFMKLLEENKRFIVKDPEKAHLFYLPFSSQFLRWAFGKNFHNKRELQKLLKKYVDLIGKKYRFWNRNGGSDHFLVACHDWASKLTRHLMKNCIRALCNANAATDFEIGRDTSLPVTYIHSMEDPIKDIGGKPPSEKTTLAFFAGSMHGYLRPILLHYWKNKEVDMKIVGPMPNGSEGERAYTEQMKSSKYCICARGYQVHTPRVIEAILSECVPVIISDNYVPPFFEVLNWEAFSVFVEEREIPNLRDILLSIPEDKYLAMHSRVKMVQQHFLWRERPAKYDVFHMILHSIWYTRVFQMKTN